MSLLQNDDPFPAVSGPTVSGGELTIPDDLNREWSVILYYRGEW